jgi:hypothetical protein
MITSLDRTEAELARRPGSPLIEVKQTRFPGCANYPCQMKGLSRLSEGGHRRRSGDLGYILGYLRHGSFRSSRGLQLPSRRVSVMCQGYRRRSIRVAAAGLDPDTVTAYALRHSSIVRALLLNIPIRIVASGHDTSVAMIESNYSRHISQHSDELSRRALLQDAPAAGNVIALAKR